MAGQAAAGQIAAERLSPPGCLCQRNHFSHGAACGASHIRSVFHLYLRAPRRHFHSHGLPGYLHELFHASLRPAFYLLGSHAQSACLVNHRVHHLLGQRDIGQCAHFVGWSPLLHLDGSEPSIVGAGFQEGAYGVSERFAGGIVNVGFQQHHGLARIGQRSRLTEHDLREVRAIFQLAGARAETAGFYFHGRHGAEAGSEAGDEGCACGGGHLGGDVQAESRHALKYLGHGGRRVGHQPVRAAYHAHALRHRAGKHISNAEHFQRAAGADNVNNGVKTADFVKMDLRRGLVVKPAFGLGDQIEGREGTLAHPFGQTGFFQQAGDVADSADDRSLFRQDRNFGGRYAAPHG